MGEAARRGTPAQRRAEAIGRDAYHASERARLDQWLEARKPRERGRVVGVTKAAVLAALAGGVGWIPYRSYGRTRPRSSR